MAPRQSSVTSPPKPAKPRPDFPLYAHASKRWAKKVRGVTRFFGPWDNPQAAIELWLEQKDDLLAGREPRAKSDGLTIANLVNRFLEHKEEKVKTGELKQRTWEDYKVIGAKIIEVFGRGRCVVDLRPSDFEKLRNEFSKTHGAVTLADDVTRSKVIFNHAYKQRLIDIPIFYGEGFKKPSAATIRRERHKKCRLFKAKEIRALLRIASPQVKAMILLGINAGLGNHDCSTLPLTAIQGNWLIFPRPKTGVARKCPLWPETVKALQVVLNDRPQPKDKDCKSVFLTRCREPWTAKGKNGDSPITKEMVKLLKQLGIHGNGLGFYALRHTFETIGGESNGGQVAVNFIMGHTDNTMSGVYRERVSKRKLFKVCRHVRNWLFKAKRKSSHGKGKTSPPVAVSDLSDAPF